MSKERADLGFTDALDNFNPQDWAPNKKGAQEVNPKVQRPEKTVTAQAAEAAGFRSREPQNLASAHEEGEGSIIRRRRTGRNMQFNLKAKPETIAAFCAIADHQGWGLGETLEKAVELLARKYGA